MKAREMITLLESTINQFEDSFYYFEKEARKIGCKIQSGIDPSAIFFYFVSNFDSLDVKVQEDIMKRYANKLASNFKYSTIKEYSHGRYIIDVKSDLALFKNKPIFRVAVEPTPQNEHQVNTIRVWVKFSGEIIEFLHNVPDKYFDSQEETDTIINALNFVTHRVFLSLLTTIYK
jgi:hypothetical protein